MANEPADRLEPADLEGLAERLEATTCIGMTVGPTSFDTMPVTGPRNPDGPEAAAALRSLQARCAELEKAADWLDQSVSAAMHELKTPIGQRQWLTVKRAQLSLRRTLTKEQE